MGQSERARLDIRLKNCDADWELGAVVDDDDAHTLLLQLGGLSPPVVTAFTTHVAFEDGGVGFSEL